MLRLLVAVALLGSVAEARPQIQRDSVTGTWSPVAASERYDEKLKLDVSDIIRLKERGAIVLIDNFPQIDPIRLETDPTHLSDDYHGEIVRETCEAAGFTGPLVSCPDNLAMSPLMQALNLRVSLARNQSCLEPGQSMQVLGDLAEFNALVTVQSSRIPLEFLKDWDLSGVVVNLSKGDSQAFQVKMLYALLTRTPALLKAVALDLGIPVRDLIEKDEERARLQQKLVDLVQERFQNSSQLRAARADYRRAVAAFEGAGNNSVVVSAGNDGLADEQLAKLAGGHRLQLPVDWCQNLLFTPDTTNVGSAADYSSEGPDVDLYASGQAGVCLLQGTSFAAPRVAVVMANLHREHPDLTSQQIEELMIRTCTRELPGYGPLLNEP